MRTNVKNQNNRYDCFDCVIKHVSTARALLKEYLSNPSEYVFELGLCIGELSCAEDHLLYSNIPEFCKIVRSIRLNIQKNRNSIENLMNLDEFIVVLMS